MNISTVIHGLGHLLVFLSFLFFVPASIAYANHGPDLPAFLWSAFCAFFTGGCFQIFTRKAELKLTRKDGFAIVAFGWILLVFFGCLPYVFADLPETQRFTFVNAFFETISGFSTTGASILSDIECLPRGLVFWRQFTSCIGGIGIVVLYLAILPALGAGGFQIYRAEVSGPSKDKFTPKIGGTAKILFGVYLLISVAEFLCLWTWCGLDWFDSSCQTFGTVATCGFSNKNLSIAAFNSWKVDLVITVFMYLSGCNFILFVHLMRRKWRSALINSELWTYTGILVFCILFMTAWNYNAGSCGSQSIMTNFRFTAFQVVSIMSTTGFCTQDFDLWGLPCQMMLVALMFIGASAGSTCGGLKVFRMLILYKTGLREIFQLLRPRAVLPIKVEGRNLSEDLVKVVLGFICLYFFSFALILFLVVCIDGDRFDLVSLFAGCAACLGGVGPGLGRLGPTDNYSALSDASKWSLSFLMLLGRLELYAILVLFHRDFWKK